MDHGVVYRSIIQKHVLNQLLNKTSSWQKVC